MFNVKDLYQVNQKLSFIVEDSEKGVLARTPEGVVLFPDKHKGEPPQPGDRVRAKITYCLDSCAFFETVAVISTKEQRNEVNSLITKRVQILDSLGVPKKYQKPAWNLSFDLRPFVERWKTALKLREEWGKTPYKVLEVEEQFLDWHSLN